MAPDLSALTQSPVLMVGVGGAALLGVAYFVSRNRPTTETVGGTLPFSFDALANWLNGREGGPGPPVPPVPDPNPDPLPHPGPLPLPCAPGYHRDTNGQCVIDYTDPTPDPGPGPIPWWCRGPFGEDRPCPLPPMDRADEYANDAPAESLAVGGGGGANRMVGFSPQALFERHYNLRAAHIAALEPEEGYYYGGH